ncbi:TIGR01777 family oxidoreductase [Algivirga pacifica]|uniref:TIGR01777 family oxidoreductase n=1 Tax=Algivirga pacifica TaxID=1162670 RepID=A0ABP9DGZ6_9BACT
MKKNVLITGGTGLLGQAITDILLNKGYSVSYLSRKARTGDKVKYYQWDPEKGMIDPEAIQQAHYIIHLAGANVGGQRWTEAYKAKIVNSRVQSGKLLSDKLKELDHQVEAFISASAVGYYGHTGGQLITESAEAGSDFLAGVCVAWEKSTQPIVDQGIRGVWIRIGVVLAEGGGALAKMVLPVKYMVGSPLGSGKQYVSWIHIEDIARLFVFALENEQMKGVYNGAAPIPVTNKELTETIAKVLGRPILLPNVPEFALRLLLGEQADIVLKGCKVYTGKIKHQGFTFKHPDLQEALKGLL